MTISMQDDSMVSIAELKEFVKLSNHTRFRSTDRAEAYEWIGRTLGKFRYFGLSKKEKGIVRQYLRAMTGYSDTQLDRLIARKKAWGRIVPKERIQPVFPRVYTVEDIARIAEVDNAEGRRNGAALKKRSRTCTRRTAIGGSSGWPPFPSRTCTICAGRGYARAVR